MLRRRSDLLPTAVAAHLARTDRVLLAERLAGGGWAVITRDALVLADDDGIRLRAAWHEIDTGAWEGSSLTFTITWADRRRADEQLVLTHDDVATFTAALRERVQASVVHAETIELGPARVRATVRRREDGALYSMVTAFGALEGTPEETAEIDDLERRVRESAGLES